MQDCALVLLDFSVAFIGHMDSNSPFVPLVSEIQILLRLCFVFPQAHRKQVGLVVFFHCLHKVLGDLLLSNPRLAAQISCVKLCPSSNKIVNFSFAVSSCSQLNSLSKEK